MTKNGKQACGRIESAQAAYGSEGAMRKRRLAFPLGVMAALAAGVDAWSAGPGQPLGSDALMAEVKSSGASVVVAKLRAENRDWEEVTAKIAAGSEEWLAVASALRPGTEAAAAVSMDEAIFLAIVPAPVAVLKLLDGNLFDVDTVCSAQIETDHSPEQSRNLVKDRIKVLQRVASPELQTVRNHCLKNLKAALKELADPIY